MRIVLPAVVLGLLASGAACREPSSSRATLVCAEFCECLTADPDEQQECNFECREDLSFRGVTDECYECVTESISCFWTLEVCIEECVDNGGDDEPPILPVDAPFPFPTDAPF